MAKKDQSPEATAAREQQALGFSRIVMSFWQLAALALDQSESIGVRQAKAVTVAERLAKEMAEANEL